MSSVLIFPNSNPLRIVTEQFDGLNTLDPQQKLFKYWSIPYFDSFFQPFLPTDLLTVQWSSSFDTINRVKIKNYLNNSDVATYNPAFSIDRGAFKIYEQALDISALSGKYYIEVTGTDSDTKTYAARSEPFEVRGSFCRTSILEYYNTEPFDGIDYRTGVVFRLRIPAVFLEDAETNEEEAFTDSGYNRIKIEDTTFEARKLNWTREVPSWLIKKVTRVLMHEYCTINGVAVSSAEKFAPEFRFMDYWAKPLLVIPLFNNGIPNIELAGERVLLPNRVLDLSGIAGIGENTLNWTDTNDGEAEYQVWAYQGTDAPTLLDTVDGVTYTHVTSGTWNYFVVAIRFGSSSSASNIVTLTVIEFDVLFDPNNN